MKASGANHFLEGVRVRRSTPADAPAVIAAIETVCAEGIFFQTDNFVLDRHWEAVLYRPGDAPQHLLAVAELEGQLIGHVRLFSGMCGAKDRHVAELGVLVLPAYRGRGVGQLLVAYALDWAGEQGLKKIVLNVFATNHRALRLYRRLGFVLEGTRKMQYNIKGQYVDEFLMAKFLPG
ncbi:MAG: GNAT family N-acetyltransferase [Anaerolineae bacterium]